VDADSLTVGDGAQDHLAGGSHVAEEEGVVAGQVSRDEPPRLLGVAEPASDEHARRRLADAEVGRERGGFVVVAGRNRPVHPDRQPYGCDRMAPAPLARTSSPGAFGPLPPLLRVVANRARV
jgi:hypothetical protein